MTSSHNAPSPAAATLRDYLKILRRQRVLMLGCIALCLGLAVVYSARQDERYKAEASLAFREPTQDVELIGVPAGRFNTPEQRAAVGTEQANRRDVLEHARRELGIATRAEDLDEQVEARAEVRTNLVIVEAEAGTARDAALLANGVAQSTIEIVRREQRARYADLIRTTERERRRVLRGTDEIARIERRRLEQQLVPLRAARKLTDPVQLVQPAAQPAGPFSPKPLRNSAIGLIAGILLAMLLASLRVALDRRLRGASEVQSVTDLPLLTLVREEALGRVHSGREAGDEEAESDLEAFRILRANLTYLDIDADVRTVVVTSPLPEDGKSTVAASLAAAEAMAGKRCLLVECDLRRPVLAERLGIEAAPGLTDFLSGRAQPPQIVRAVALSAPPTNGNGGDHAPAAAPEQPLLAVIPAGGTVPRPAELLASDRFARVLAEVRDAYDLVVLDTPPLLPVGDTLGLVPRADAVVLCVRSERTTRDELRSAVESLQRLPDKPAGLVVTGVREGRDSEYGYYTYSYAYPAR